MFSLMSFLIVLSPEAIEDIDTGFTYFNKLPEGLGFEFTDTIDLFLKKISQWPTAASIRYYILHYFVHCLYGILFFKINNIRRFNDFNVV
jgi:hypothetical protein